MGSGAPPNNNQVPLSLDNADIITILGPHALIQLVSTAIVHIYIERDRDHSYACVLVWVI